LWRSSEQDVIAHYPVPESASEVVVLGKDPDASKKDELATASTTAQILASIVAIILV